MIELLFLACLASAPDECQTRSLVFANVTQLECVIGAQPLLAKWVESHPQWEVSQWKCRHVDTTKTEA